MHEPSASFQGARTPSPGDEGDEPITSESLAEERSLTKT